jgi:hypothetical protein
VNLFGVVSRWAWLIFIVVALLNFLFAARSDPADAQVDTGLCRRYLARLWGFACLPWLVLGFGQVTGNIPNVWAIFRPQDGNPYVWAFFLSILLVYLVMAWWVMFRDGARIAAELQLMRFHTLGKSSALSAFWIKVIAVGSLPFFVFWLWVVVKMDAPLPLIR